MKLSNMFRYLLLAAIVSIGLGVTANAAIVAFSAAYGQGDVTQTYNGGSDDMDEPLSYPVVDSYSTGGGSNHTWHITVDTDNGTGYFSVGYTVQTVTEIEVHVY